MALLPIAAHSPRASVSRFYTHLPLFIYTFRQEGTDSFLALCWSVEVIALQAERVGLSQVFTTIPRGKQLVERDVCKEVLCKLRSD